MPDRHQAQPWSSGPRPAADEAQLLEWELILPSPDDTAAVERSVRGAGYHTEHDAHGMVTADPWHTRVRILANE